MHEFSNIVGVHLYGARVPQVNKSFDPLLDIVGR